MKEKDEDDDYKDNEENKENVEINPSLDLNENKINEESNENKIGEENNENKINEEKNENNNIEAKNTISSIQSKNFININTSSEIYIHNTSELNGKTLYHIKGNFLDKHEEIVRRYRDFHLLHLKLAQNWPCIFIPPIAQKKYFGSQDQQTINERIYQLENFLKISTKSAYLIETEELKTFLNKDILSSDVFQVEIKKLKPYTLQQISENYTKYFSEYKNLKTQEFTDEQSNICIEFINNFNIKLNKYKEQLIEFGEVKKTKIYRESKIASYFTEFEKYSMMEFVNNDLSSLFFFNGSSSLLENKKKYNKYINNPYLVLSCWLRLKELELITIKNSLNEYKTLLAKRITIENKQRDISLKLKDIEEGRISFLDKIMLKGDQKTLKEKYQHELETQNNEVKYINNIVKILNDYFAVEVYKYFDQLKTSFYDTVKKFATIQKENCTLATDLWFKVKCKNRKEDENNDLNDIFDEVDEHIENDINDNKNDSNENNDNNDNNENNENNNINNENNADSNNNDDNKEEK